MVTGHDSQREMLRSFPAEGRVVLLQGLPGIGKWLCAREVAQAAGGATVSLRNPTMEEVRELVRFAERAPVSGTSSVLIDLDSMTERGMNTLLKTLEEPPSWLAIYLVAGRPILPTLRSRVTDVIEFDPLARYEVQLILEDQGMQRHKAEAMAKLSGGRVDMALMFDSAETVKPVVMGFLDAVERHDYQHLTIVSQSWSDLAKTLMERWYQEAGVWVITGVVPGDFFYSADELSLLHSIGSVRSWGILQAIREGYSPDAAARNAWKNA